MVNRFRNQSITRNLTLSLLLMLGIVAVMTLYANAYLSNRRAKLELEDKLQEYLTALAESLGPAVWNFDEDAIRIIGEAYRRNDLISELQIQDHNGTRYFAFKKPGVAGRVAGTTPIVHQGNRIGTLSIALSADYYTTLNRRFLGSYALTLSLMISILFLSSTVLLRQLLKQPFARFIALVNAYAAGQPASFDEQLPYREFQPLLSVLRQMSATISTQMRSLRQAEQKYRSIVDNAVVGIFQMTPDGRMIGANPAAAHTLGYAAPDDLIQSVRDIQRQLYVRSEQWAVFKAQIEHEQHVAGFEAQFFHKNGHIIWVALDARPVYDEGGRILYVEGFLQDITPRKQAEEQVRIYHEHLEDLVNERTAQLSETNERLESEVIERRAIAQDLRRARDKAQQYLDIAGVMLLVFNPDQTVRLINKKGCEVLGYQEHEILGARWSERYLPERERARVSAVFAQVMAGDVAPVGYFENPVLTKQGEERLIAWHNAVLRDEAGNITGILSSGEDITLRRQAEIALKQAKETAETAQHTAEVANRAKSIFLANMSHELRTPLNAVLGFSELLGHDPALSPTQREYMETITRSGEHLLTLINDVLDITRIEAGRIELHQTICDLRGLLFEVMAMLRNRAEAKHLSLTLDLAPAAPRVIQADAPKLRQILVNLIGNAIKFTETGGVTVSVSKLKTENSRLKTTLSSPTALPPVSSIRFQVSDSGVGITPEDQERIFKPFEQVGSLADMKGTGLGLTITRQYADLMGGTIRVESTPGKGSVFTVTLPIEIAEQSSIVNRQSSIPGRVIGLEPGQPAYRALIVEDQQENRRLLRTILEPIGFDVREAVNGVEAVQLFQAWQPQVIFMDWRMPVMNGLEATQAIRKLETGNWKLDADDWILDTGIQQPTSSSQFPASSFQSRTPIIAITASAFKEQHAEMLAAGTDDVISKPFHATEILESIRVHLGVRYVYAPEAGEALAEESTPATPEKLAVLPPELLAHLAQAITQLDTIAITRLIDAIQLQDAASAQTFSRLAKRFQYRDMLTLIQTIQEQQQ